MSAEQIKETIGNLDSYVNTMFEYPESFLDIDLSNKSQDLWDNNGKKLIAILKDKIEHVDFNNIKTEFNSYLNDDILQLKVDIIEALSEDVHKYARRMLDCITTFLSSLAHFIPEIRGIVDAINEILSYFKNVIN